MKIVTMSPRRLLVGTVLLFCLGLALAFDVYGKGQGIVSSIRDGILERLENKGWQQMAEAQRVSMGERLRTDETAVAVIELPDVGKFVIGPSSDLELGKNAKDFKTRIDRGAVWLRSDLPKGSKASITTSIATAGIRGTALSVVYGKGGKAVWICTCTGETEAVAKTGQKIKVPKGQSISIPLDGPVPEKPGSSLPVLEKRGTVFDFCFNCHIVGGKGKLKPDWK